jgi:hypothetical protein
MSANDLEILADLKKLEKQVGMAIKSIESDVQYYPLPKDEIKINQGYQVGDFTITPRFPKTDFQG